MALVRVAERAARVRTVVAPPERAEGPAAAGALARIAAVEEVPRHAALDPAADPAQQGVVAYRAERHRRSLRARATEQPPQSRRRLRLADLGCLRQRVAGEDRDRRGDGVPRRVLLDARQLRLHVLEAL